MYYNRPTFISWMMSPYTHYLPIKGPLVLLDKDNCRNALWLSTRPLDLEERVSWYGELYHTKKKSGKLTLASLYDKGYAEFSILKLLEDYHIPEKAITSGYNADLPTLSVLEKVTATLEELTDYDKLTLLMSDNIKAFDSVDYARYRSDSWFRDRIDNYYLGNGKKFIIVRTKEAFDVAEWRDAFESKLQQERTEGCVHELTVYRGVFGEPLFGCQYKVEYSEERGYFITSEITYTTEELTHGDLYLDLMLFMQGHLDVVLQKVIEN